MKSFALVSLAGLSLAAAWQSVPAPLANSFEKLDKAAGFKATFTVVNNAGAPEAFTLTYAKPNMYLLVGPNTTVVSDGTKTMSYSKSSNTHEEGGASWNAINEPSVYAWASFFNKESVKTYKSAKVGAKRNIKGNLVQEVSAQVTGPNEGSIVVFVDEKLGLPRGFTFKTAKQDLLVIATELEVSDKAAGASVFAFTPPAGAKKAEPAESRTDVPTYRAVQALFNRTCMPCHSTQNRQAGYDLSNYDGVKAGVKAGSPDGSQIVQSIRSGRMPKNRSKLSPADIKLVEDWVTAGASK